MTPGLASGKTFRAALCLLIHPHYICNVFSLFPGIKCSRFTQTFFWPSPGSSSSTGPQFLQRKTAFRHEIWVIRRLLHGFESLSVSNELKNCHLCTWTHTQTHHTHTNIHTYKYMMNFISAYVSGTSMHYKFNISDSSLILWNYF